MERAGHFSPNFSRALPSTIRSLEFEGSGKPFYLLCLMAMIITCFFFSRCITPVWGFKLVILCLAKSRKGEGVKVKN